MKAQWSRATRGSSTATEDALVPAPESFSKEAAATKAFKQILPSKWRKSLKKANLLKEEDISVVGAATSTLDTTTIIEEEQEGDQFAVAKDVSNTSMWGKTRKDFNIKQDVNLNNSLGVSSGPEMIMVGERDSFNAVDDLELKVDAILERADRAQDGELSLKANLTLTLTPTPTPTLTLSLTVCLNLDFCCSRRHNFYSQNF